MRRLIVNALMLALGACSGEATEQSVGGQTLARVNGEPITIGDVELELALLPPDLRADARTHVLEGLVDRKLLAQDARARGDERSAEFVRLQRRSHELLLAQRTADLVAARFSVATVGEAERFLTAQPQFGAGRRLFTIDRVVLPVASTQASEALLEALAKAPSIDELMAHLARAKIAASRVRQDWDSAEMSVDQFAVVDALRKHQPMFQPVFRKKAIQTEAIALVAERLAPRSRDEAMRRIRKRLSDERAVAAIKAHEKSLRKVSTIVVMPGKRQ